MIQQNLIKNFQLPEKKICQAKTWSLCTWPANARKTSGKFQSRTMTSAVSISCSTMCSSKAWRNCWVSRGYPTTPCWIKRAILWKKAPHAQAAEMSCYTSSKIICNYTGHFPASLSRPFRTEWNFPGMTRYNNIYIKCSF